MTMRRIDLPFLVLGGLALGGLGLCSVTLLGCGGESDSGPGVEDDGAAELDEWDRKLQERELDYGAALRSAALRLTGDLPTLEEIQAVGLGSEEEQKQAYEAIIRSYLDDTRFRTQMVRWWRDVFKMGGNGQLNRAANFAAQLTWEGRPYTELFTAQSGACPTYSGADGFTPEDCGSGAPSEAGVLTNPGAMAHYMSPMAFRRVRWVQETFACTAFPTESDDADQDRADDGLAAYTSPWPLDSISGALNGAPVDFHDRESVACANCHSTMNHLAPLFANFDGDGIYQPTVQVTTPIEGDPITERTHWLPEGETTAWRFGQQVSSLAELGQAMAADPVITECAVARVWNWALGRGDIVDALALIPADVIGAQLEAFVASDYDLKELMYSVYTSDDFVRF